ncbi:hypothetical protein [Nonomuraea guangzhouensis]|uniref:Choice-of-anchor A family protein n=1 Tax=Nonomuraea guangzhouensis TaxID=1291555 RepID=A0ABW4G573_9ACTN|nr:hypothetical protein [Nonomuraea guangzhouensis]
MSRWRKALIAASVGMAASAAFVVTSTPGEAESSLVAKYLCTGGVAGSSVQLEATITPRLTEGGMLNVGWALKYQGTRRFGSPGFFPAGSTLNLEGVVDISGAWTGQLRPKGSKDQADLVPGDQLVLPEGLSDAGSVQRSGTVRVKPGALVVRFKPAEGEVMVNNHKSVISYTSDWSRIHTEEEFGDHLYDLHKTTTKDGVAKLSFIGTQVAYISRRERDLSDVQVRLDGDTVTDGLVEPGKDRSGTEMTGTEAQEVLWESPVLDYGPHTIEVVNTEARTAYVDAFKVTTGDLDEPPTHNQATCTLQGDPGAIEVTVPGATPNSPTPTPTPTPTPPTSTPTTKPSGSATPSSTPTVSYPNVNPGIDRNLVSVVPGGVSTSTATPKPTTTKTKYVKAQVAKTPKGGVDSGVAPEPGRGSYGLIAGGSMLLMGSVTGGLLLRRRKAGHTGGVES